ncbi:hypothetical protein OUZ56_007038 [Daphnia magna]|uniref:Uncharacterized protein n=1 Tax=Daphnia magna TaxID=35525 RepID=A0ABQ9YXE6_9CRUS|nr:hypothetical protein OUZ56_007038 [Daphnia magna]
MKKWMDGGYFVHQSCCQSKDAWMKTKESRKACKGGVGNMSMSLSYSMNCVHSLVDDQLVGDKSVFERDVCHSQLICFWMSQSRDSCV